MVLAHGMLNGWEQEEPQWEAYAHVSTKSNHVLIGQHLLSMYTFSGSINKMCALVESAE